MNAERFNALYEVGVPVFAYPGCRPEDVPNAPRLVTRTRTKAQSVGLDREGVVWVDGHGAYISLTHVDVVSETVYEAAKQAEWAASVSAAAKPQPASDDPRDVEIARLQRKVASLKELQGKDDAEYAEAIAERDRALKLAAELEAARIDCVAVPRWEYELMEQQRERATRAEARIDELEAERNAWPSRFTATPAEVDWFLRKHLTEEALLNYQRAIGNRAVEEAAEEIRQETARLKAHGVLEPDKDWAASSAADWIDTSKEGGHYPSRLLCARHDGFNPCPGAPRCTPREDEAVTS